MKSRAGYWLGSVLLVLGVVGAIAVAVVRVINVIDEVEHWPRASAEKPRVTLEARRYTVYLEWRDSLAHGNTLTDLQIREARTERPVPLDTGGGTTTYDFPDHHGVSVARFTAPRAGSYRVTAAGLSPGAELVFGTSVLRTIASAALVAGLVLLAGVVPGLILLIGTAIRRNRRPQAPKPWP